MDSDTKQRIIKYIRANDPNGDVVATIAPSADFLDGRISYNIGNLRLGREISRLTDEEYVRAFLCVRFVSECGYPASSLELERTYSIGRPSTKAAHARSGLVMKGADTAGTVQELSTPSARRR